MKKHFIIIALMIVLPTLIDAGEITPYKFSEADIPSLNNLYTIPQSSRYTVATDDKAADTIYHLSKPPTKSYPIVCICDGSSSRDSILSSIHIHRYFLQEILDLGCATLTVEKHGVDGNNIDLDRFISHYTRTQRLKDHQSVIAHLTHHKPHGWNGKLVFIGVSEGGPIALRLTEKYSADTIATVIWSGAGDFCWQEELWAFIEDLKCKGPWWLKLLTKVHRFIPLPIGLPRDKESFDDTVAHIIQNPTDEKEFMGMTYAYLADAFTFPKVNYHHLCTPLLVVTGAHDSIIDSSDEFVRKAHEAQCPITYLRVSDMDHYIRKRPDIVAASFKWLHEKLEI